MKIIDVMGKPCPIPVIEAKKALSERKIDRVQLKVDNFVAVQNLEKMANGSGHDFSYSKVTGDEFDVTISKDKESGSDDESDQVGSITVPPGAALGGLVVAIGRNTMGEGAEELGKVLIKGFIYALSELPNPPEFLIFFNSGAYLTSENANTIADLKFLEANGTKILTCGSCINYYGLKTPAVGEITDMYGIAETLTSAASVVNI